MKWKGSLSGKSAIVKVSIWLGLMLLLTGLLLAGFAQIFGTHYGVSGLRQLQVAQTFSVFILPSLIAAWLWSDEPLKWLHLDKGMSWQVALTVPLAVIVLAPGINLLSAWNQSWALPPCLSGIEEMFRQLEEAAAAATEQLAQAESVPEWLLNIVIMALLPAIGEELCFRGSAQGLISNRGDTLLRPVKHKPLSADAALPVSSGRRSAPTLGEELSRTNKCPIRTHVAVWVTAILFSAIHFQFYGFVPRMLLGAMLGYLLVWTGSLYVPMLAHFTNNAIAVTCYFLAGEGVISADACDSFGTGETAWIGWLSLAGGLAMLWLIRQVATKGSAAIAQD